MKTNIHFWSYLPYFLSEWEIFSDKSCRENQNPHFVFSNFFFFENCNVYEIMWKNTVEWDRPKMTIWRMRITCWITKATNTYTVKLCNTCCFSTATMVAWTRLNVTLYVHGLACWIFLWFPNHATTFVPYFPLSCSKCNGVNTLRTGGVI